MKLNKLGSTLILALSISACGVPDDQPANAYAGLTSPYVGAEIVNNSNKKTDAELAAIIDYEWRAVKECVDMEYDMQVQIEFRDVVSFESYATGHTNGDVWGTYHFVDFKIVVATGRHFDTEWKQTLRHELQHHIRHLDGDTDNNLNHYIWWNCDYVYPALR
jgi:hypothetical protein|tara:strand:+ start:15789 stop:16274 length:486 start_codon:yes stop_codon:yes gene_type:complete